MRARSGSDVKKNFLLKLVYRMLLRDEQSMLCCQNDQIILFEFFKSTEHLLRQEREMIGNTSQTLISLQGSNKPSTNVMRLVRRADPEREHDSMQALACHVCRQDQNVQDGRRQLKTR